MAANRVLLLILGVRPLLAVLVDIPRLGALQGSTSQSLWSERTIYQFQGIPYAQSPSGPLRFKAPVPAVPWEGVLNATQFQRRCPQLGLTEKEMLELQMSTDNVEDCLYLNVYTPQLPGGCRSHLPVMFYIHGGSFRLGSAHDYRPNHLLERDILLVVIQYRLGPLGFLSLQNDEIPGNMGFFDMLLALEWVQEHIWEFCGDPHQVTIFGQSSGAAAVSLMLVSPLTSTDLFQRAIIQSGSSLCDWAIDYSPKQHAKTIAKHANCTNSNVSEMIKCLQELSAFDLLHGHTKFLIKVLIDEGRAVGGNNGGNQAVVQSSGHKRFIVEDPRISFREQRFHKIPLMIGVTKHEGTFFAANIFEFILERLNTTNNTNFLKSEFLKSVLQFNGIDDNTGALSDIFESAFFKDKEVGNFTKMINGLVDICGDALVKGCTFNTARVNRMQRDTFLYTFNFQGHLTKFWFGEEDSFPFPGGVAHSDDLLYLFPPPKGSLNEREKEVAKMTVELWTNFAINGKPTPAQGVPDWPPMSDRNGPYLRIDHTPRIRENFLDEYYVTVKEGLYKSSASFPPASNLFLFFLVLFSNTVLALT